MQLTNFKKLFFTITLLTSTLAWAQKNKNTPVQSTTTTNSSYRSKIVAGNLGLNNSALNLGIVYDSGANTGSLGGSFFLQTEKEDDGITKINQVLTFGAHVNMNILEIDSFVLDLRPGINLSMVQDIPNASGKKDDKTVIGPSVRWTMAHRLSSGLEVGFERLEIWNWFDDDAPSDASYTSLVFRNRF